MEHIYSDALAVRLGGEREFCTPARKFIDVYIQQVGTVVEVKHRPRSNDVRSAIAQLIEHRRSMGDVNLQFHAVLSQRREARSAESRAIDEHREWMAEERISLTVETARDLPSVYTIAGSEFLHVADVLIHCNQIKKDFAVSEFLCDAHREFLMALADGWSRRSYKRPAVNVEPSVTRVGRNTAMMLSVHSGGVFHPVAFPDLVRRWAELVHYRWIYLPH
jgi:hypothetical protein